MIKATQSDPFIQELKEKAKRTHTPIYGAFELTARCNLNCKMCYVHDQNATRARSKELSTDQWKRIFDEAIAEGMVFALLTGGECLLRDDFEELYLYLFNKGIIMSVNTNGILISEEKADFFAKYQPERIQISIYGSSNDHYEQVTEKREFDRVSAAIERLEKRGLKPDIAITPSRFMTDCEEILKLVRDKGLPYTLSPALISPRDGSSNDDSSLSLDDIVANCVAERKIFGKKLKEHDSPAPAPGCSCEEALHGMPCNAGTIRAAITYDGRMTSCLSIPEIFVNVLETGYHEGWEYIWRKMAETVVPLPCTECYYKNRCVFCPVLRYDGLFSGKCKEEFCELMVKKYEAGIF